MFFSAFGEVLAEWPTDQIVKLRWLQEPPSEANIDQVSDDGDAQRAGQPWSDEETDVAAAFRPGTSITEIAARHKRTTGAIRSRLEKLDVLHDDVADLPAQTETGPRTLAAALLTEVEINEIVWAFRRGSSLREISAWQATTIPEVRQLLEERGEWPAPSTLEPDACGAPKTDVRLGPYPSQAKREPQLPSGPKGPGQDSKLSPPIANGPDRFEEEALGHLRH